LLMMAHNHSEFFKEISIRLLIFNDGYFLKRFLEKI
jgi:hypothetical protein